MKTLYRCAEDAFCVLNLEKMSHSRRNDLVQARTAIAIYLKDQCDLTYVRIAELLSKKDHATIVNCVKNHVWAMTSKDFKSRFYATQFKKFIELVNSCH